MAFIRKMISAGLLAGVCSQSWASGFAISAKSTSSLGNAFAGTTVSADDASVIYSNPALMQQLEGDSFTFLLHNIIAGVQYKDDGSNTSGAENQNIDKVHFVPNLYYFKELSDDVSFGFGIYSPFGLGLAYDKNWVGRYHTTESNLRTSNFSPAFSFAASEKLNLGVGFDIQYLQAELNNAMDFGTICAIYESYGQIPAGTCTFSGLQPQQNDGSQSLQGKNWALGYSMGMTYDFSQATRMGMTFHSATRHDVEGTSEFDNVPTIFAGTFSNTDASLMLMLPESLSIGIRHVLTPKLELLGDYTWTRWSRYDKLVVELDNGLPNSVTENGWKDVPRYAVGLNYQWKDDWMIRAGAVYDVSPVPKAELLSPRVPDANKLTLALGSKLGLTKTLDLDAAVTYTLPSKPDIDNTDGLGHTLKGSYEVDTSYVSVQLNWKL